ncbi:MAG TPA: CPBP family intramembrane glutamic endopeptidase [Gemmatimonadales bacterium]|nr:CPBP family intramembrane glutamic endopeptidase [Gemmatimonadales bacterium]
MVAFFLVTYAVTWTLWIAASAAPLSGALRELLFLPGTVAPALVALRFTARWEGPAATQALVGRLFAWRVQARWYGFAVGYLAVIKMTAAIAQRLVTGAWPGVEAVSWWLLAAAIPLSTLVQAGEEIGWRGYALPRLAARLGLARASVVLGVIWGSWHLPLFFIPGTDVTGQSFPVYLLSVSAVSVALAWLYGHTNGSLLLVMLMHAAINNTPHFVPPSGANVFALSSSLAGWLTTLLLWLCTGYFLLRMPELAER